MAINLDPSMTQGGTRQSIAQNDATRQLRHDDYTKSRNAFAAQHMRTLGDSHPHLHGGHRTVEDVHSDLDAGHRILSGGSDSYSTRSSWGDNRQDHTQRHNNALEVGYAANAHTYIQRQSDAKRAADAAAYHANAPKPKNYGF